MIKIWFRNGAFSFQSVLFSDLQFLFLNLHHAVDNDEKRPIQKTIFFSEYSAVCVFEKYEI